MKLFMQSLAFFALCLAIIWMGVMLAEKNQQIASLQQDIKVVRTKAQARKTLLIEARNIYHKLAKNRWVKQVTVTAYNPTTEQCDEDPHVAASMRKVRSGTVAVSRDLFDQGWVFGKKIRIEGMGIFEINDLMNKRFENRIDVFMWDQGKALSFGKKQIKAALLDI